MAKKTATPTTVTLKHLAAANRRRARVVQEGRLRSILNDMVGRITKHLKKGRERIRIVGLGNPAGAQARPPAWAATPPPARRSTSRPARRLPSVQPRNSRKPSDKTPFSMA